MTTNLDPDFSLLLSDDVFLEGMLASDTHSLWRRLARTAVVREMAALIAGEPTRITALCSFVQRLLGATCDARYRHPHEMAACAALVILEQSPLAAARSLLAQLRAERRPSLALVQATAEYCDSRFVDSTVVSFPVSPGMDALQRAPFWVAGSSPSGITLSASNVVELQQPVAA
jgi:hypothetical protein